MSDSHEDELDILSQELLRYEQNAAAQNWASSVPVPPAVVRLDAPRSSNDVDPLSLGAYDCSLVEGYSEGSSSHDRDAPCSVAFAPAVSSLRPSTPPPKVNRPAFSSADMVSPVRDCSAASFSMSDVEALSLGSADTRVPPLPSGNDLLCESCVTAGSRLRGNPPPPLTPPPADAFSSFEPQIASCAPPFRKSSGTSRPSLKAESSFEVSLGPVKAPRRASRGTTIVRFAPTPEVSLSETSVVDAGSSSSAQLMDQDLQAALESLDQIGAQGSRSEATPRQGSFHSPCQAAKTKLDSSSSTPATSSSQISTTPTGESSSRTSSRADQATPERASGDAAADGAEERAVRGRRRAHEEERDRPIWEAIDYIKDLLNSSHDKFGSELDGLRVSLCVIDETTTHQAKELEALRYACAHSISVEEQALTKTSIEGLRQRVESLSRCNDMTQIIASERALTRKEHAALKDDTQVLKTALELCSNDITALRSEMEALRQCISEKRKSCDDTEVANTGAIQKLREVALDAVDGLRRDLEALKVAQTQLSDAQAAGSAGVDTLRERFTHLDHALTVRLEGDEEALRDLTLSSKDRMDEFERRFAVVMGDFGRSIERVDGCLTSCAESVDVNFASWGAKLTSMTTGTSVKIDDMRTEVLARVERLERLQDGSEQKSAALLDTVCQLRNCLEALDQRVMSDVQTAGLDARDRESLAQLEKAYDTLRRDVSSIKPTLDQLHNRMDALQQRNGDSNRLEGLEGAVDALSQQLAAMPELLGQLRACIEECEDRSVSIDDLQELRNCFQSELAPLQASLQERASPLSTLHHVQQCLNSIAQNSKRQETTSLELMDCLTNYLYEDRISQPNENIAEALHGHLQLIYERLSRLEQRGPPSDEADKHFPLHPHYIAGIDAQKKAMSRLTRRVRHIEDFLSQAKFGRLNSRPLMLSARSDADGEAALTFRREHLGENFVPLGFVPMHRRVSDLESLVSGQLGRNPPGECELMPGGLRTQRSQEYFPEARRATSAGAIPRLELSDRLRGRTPRLDHFLGAAVHGRGLQSPPGQRSAQSKTPEQSARDARHAGVQERLKQFEALIESQRRPTGRTLSAPGLRHHPQLASSCC